MEKKNCNVKIAGKFPVNSFYYFSVFRSISLFAKARLKGKILFSYENYQKINSFSQYFECVLYFQVL